MKNIFLDPHCLKNNQVHIRGEYYHYLKNVRRVRKGRVLDAVIGNRKYTLKVSFVNEEKIVCDIIGQKQAAAPVVLPVYVYQGVLKARKTDIVVSKLSEIGVRAFYPLRTGRNVTPRTVGENKLNRWKRLSREGAKVTGFEKTMEIRAVANIMDVLEEFGGYTRENTARVVLLFSTQLEGRPLRTVLEGLDESRVESFHLFFGPEGGFSEEETNAIIEKAGAVPVTMGKFVLRSETACVLATGFIRLFYSAKS
ncbi:MAG: RsmE family RNA methyltransferase [Spirochaetota bacterium]